MPTGDAKMFDQMKYDGRHVGWCTRCGGDEFNGVRHRCRKPSEDAAEMIAVRKDNAKLRATLEQIKTVCIDNAADTVRHDLALKFVGGVAEAALRADQQSQVQK